jgi:hypothetical protein
MNGWGRKWKAVWQKVPLIRVLSEMELWFWVHFVEFFLFPISWVKNHQQSASEGAKLCCSFANFHSSVFMKCITKVNNRFFSVQCWWRTSVHNFPQKLAMSEGSKPVECSSCGFCPTFLLQVSHFSWHEWNTSPQNRFCIMTETER